MSVARTPQPLVSLRVAAVFAAVLVAVHGGLVAATQSDLPRRVLLNNLYFPLVAGVSAAALLRTAWHARHSDRNTTWAWSALAGAQVGITLELVLWSVLEVGLGQNPAGSGLRAVIILLAYVLTIVGVLLLSIRPGQRTWTLPTVLDTLIVVVAAGLLVWVFVAEPTLARTPAGWLTQSLALLSPLLDLLVFFALVQLLFRQARSQTFGSIAFISIGLAFMVATDVAYSIQTLRGTYLTGGWLDVGWTISFVLYGLGGVWQTARPAAGAAERATPRLWGLILPYLWVFAIGALLLWSEQADWPIDGSTLEWGFVGVVGLVITRQVAALRENTRLYLDAQVELARRVASEAEVRRLNGQLEARVQERTAQLEQANLELKQSEARNRILLKAVPDMIFVLDQEGRFLDHYTNAQSELYVPPGQFLGRRLAEVLPADVATSLRLATAQVLGTGEMQTIEYVLPFGNSPTYFEARLISHEHDTVLAIARNITARRRAEAILRESERRFRETLANIDLAALSVNMAGNITYCNDFLLALTGWTQAEVLGHNWADIFGAGEPSPVPLFEAGVEPDTIQAHTERPVVTRAGEVRLMAWSNTTLRDPEGQVVGIASIGEDITQRQQADERLRASLNEKEILLKEIHHRVKNNLQVVSSLLNLQAQSVTDQAMVALLHDSQSRVKAMALVHETLYRSPDLARVDFASYARTLATQLLRTYAAQAGTVTLRVEAENCLLDVDAAVPCGLILNELVSNALKHAFPSGQPGRLEVEVRPVAAGRVSFSVSDDGVGFPPEVDFQNSPSLGLRLVATLVDQLGGTLVLNARAGTQFLIEFPAAQTES